MWIWAKFKWLTEYKYNKLVIRGGKNKILTMSTNENEENIAKLCIVCKVMYGNQTFENMCSKCFKDSKSKDNKYSEKKPQ